jgi:mannose-6-phosphate isomerase-like protein (cupin superfamily)
MFNIHYSKVDATVPLLTLSRKDNISSERSDLSPESEFLQCSTKLLSKGASFKPHKHNHLVRVTTKTQEAWVFIKGKVLGRFYDIDDSLYLETELGEGDCVVVFNAGHGFEVLEEGTIIYEFKTGPYFGVTPDKTFLKI